MGLWSPMSAQDPSGSNEANSFNGCNSASESNEPQTLTAPLFYWDHWIRQNHRIRWCHSVQWCHEIPLNGLTRSPGELNPAKSLGPGSNDSTRFNETTGSKKPLRGVQRDQRIKWYFKDQKVNDCNNATWRPLPSLFDISEVWTKIWLYWEPRKFECYFSMFN